MKNTRLITNIEKTIDDMYIAYLKDETPERTINFNTEELNLIKEYKDNLMIYFYVSDMNPIKKDDFSHLHDLSFVTFDRSQKSYMKLCREAGIRYDSRHYFDNCITTTKISDPKDSMILIDTFGDSIILGWEHIVNYTSMIWDKSYQKYNIIPKMKKLLPDIEKYALK